ncbi:MAG TPA: hypothetical protein VEO18_02870 [Thermoplasmata archaeon]|nr:hypothetical protein [Thermoplasmata archaeon]
MASGDFVGYVGPPDIHDGRIMRVERDGDHFWVDVKVESGEMLIFEFLGVTAIRSNRPEGMLLYSLSEMRSQAPLRRFVFTNWDTRDDAFLEVVARDFFVSRVPKEPFDVSIR